MHYICASIYIYMNVSVSLFTPAKANPSSFPPRSPWVNPGCHCSVCRDYASVALFYLQRLNPCCGLFFWLNSSYIHLTPQKLSAWRKNTPAPQAPACGQKTKCCIEGERPGRRRY